MMLHNQDADMLMLDPNHANSVMRMDLEYGKVVDEWKVSDVVDVNNILPEYVSLENSQRGAADTQLEIRADESAADFHWPL